MADHNPSDTTPLPDDSPAPRQADETFPRARDEAATSVRRPNRPVYEPTLLPPRKRRRASPWLVIPGLLVLLGAVLYVVLVLPHQRRFVPSAGRMAYASDQETPGHAHLWLANADGTGARRLTTGTADETAPAWSPDGSQIAYLSARGGGAPQVWVVDADGLNPIPVTHNAGAKTQPQFAPSDNSLLAFLAGGALNTADVSSGQTTRILPTVTDATRAQSTDAGGAAAQPATITAFAWTPAKDRSQQGLAAVEEIGGVQALVLLPTLADKPRDTRDGSGPLAAAETLSLGWAPDGALLAVALLGLEGLPGGRQASALALLDSQGNPSGQRPLAVFPGGAVGPEGPVFSPDGAQIVSEIWQGGDLALQRSAGLFVVPIDGSAPPRPIYRGQAQDVRFSSDGHALLFLQARPDGGHDLCRVNADGSGFVRLSDGRADITGLAVSPQGTARP